MRLASKKVFFKRKSMKTIIRTHTYNLNFLPSLLPEDLRCFQSLLSSLSPPVQRFTCSLPSSTFASRSRHPNYPSTQTKHPIIQLKRRPARSHHQQAARRRQRRRRLHTSFLRGPRRSDIKKWHKSCCGGGCGPGGRGVLR